MAVATAVVYGFAAAAVGLAWTYFRRFRVVRPPVGVMNGADLAFMMVAIVLVPMFYLRVSEWVGIGALTLGALGILYLTLEPVLRRRLWIWLASAACVAGVLAASRLGSDDPAFLAVNNVALLLTVVGATNLWAQSGMRARDAALLGGLLVVYDVTATTLLPHMGHLFTTLQGRPFAPITLWPIGADPGAFAALGLGDQLMAAVFPLVMRKAFGRRAGLTALFVGLGAIGVLFALPLLGVRLPLFPVMVVLGPLMAVQYGWWRRRMPERTYREYERAEPRFARSSM